jgi:malate dehydrogenase (oxaloacetate-decarboxylating)
MDYDTQSLQKHKKHKGKIEIRSTFPLNTIDELSVAYTPGVAAPCREIAKNKDLAYTYTIKSNTVAIVSDGSAVLGLGNIGPEAAIPVMEGKAILMKEFGNLDAFPICLATQDVGEIVETVVRIAPVFGGINLEDISAPRCFEIERRLKEKLDIPVFHDDQHGTAIVVLAGLYNALKIAHKTLPDVKIVVNGAGAAGIAITKLLLAAGATNIIMCDSKGTIYDGRTNLNSVKKEISKVTNKNGVSGGLINAMKSADVFIGISVGDVVSPKMVATMSDRSIVFAMANPIPEIMPPVAKEAGALIVATGRSDFPNQVNNVLVFPGIFRGMLDARLSKVTTKLMLRVAQVLADCVVMPSVDKILPLVLDKTVALKIAQAVMNSKYGQGVGKIK